MWRWLLGWCLWCHLMGLAQAQVWVNRADIEADGSVIAQAALPHYHEGGASSLRRVTARYALQAAPDLDKKFYGVLLPYPIQGGQIYLNGHLIHELEGSTAAVLHSWYRPVLLNLSRHDLRADSGNLLEFRQVGHLRGWPVLPVLFGEVAELRPVYELVFYLTETLSETINYLCGFVGVFLIAMGVVSRERKYFYAGVVAVIWVLLFKLALLREQPAEAWFAWRLALYALTGNLILCAVLFLLELARIRPGKFLVRGLIAACQLGWVVFLVAGKAAEFYLDRYWVGGVVFLYVLAILATFRRSHFHRWVKPIFLWYLVASGILATHDFLFQAGFVWDLGDGLSAVFANAVYLSHFTLPAFLGASCLMLLLEYIHRNEQAEKIRDEILNDIHDGVGARLNVLLMGLELQALDWQAVKNDVRRCIDELRFVLLPDADKIPFLIQMMEKFCGDLSERLKGNGIDFQFAFRLAPSRELSPKVALVLYFSLLECLSNVAKHACHGARTVQCVLHGEGESVSLQIEDDGPGIEGWSNEAQAFAQADARRGLGLKSLRARVAGAGGQVSIHSEAGLYTRIRIDFSLRDSDPYGQETRVGVAIRP